MKRRDFLKNMGVLTAGMAVAPELLAGETAPSMIAPDVFNPVNDEKGELNEFTLKQRSLEPLTGGKRVTVAIVGCGSRGSAYAKYCAQYPKQIEVVAVADPIEERRNKLGDMFNLPKEKRYYAYETLLPQGLLADVMFICTPDDKHYVPCMKALELGYHVLLEKPAAQTEKECRDILAQSKKYNRIVGLCHVLRYAPYFIAMREVLRKREIGDIVSVQHMEPIQYAHMAHSYVRGNWHDSKATTPIILAKSCHDLDILRWLVDKPCKSISAEGSLYLFRKENAPEGAPERCTDGCPHESTCPYSAIDIYKRKKKHLYVFDLKDRKDEDAIMEKLRTTDYGRCVYHCDNDQPDHYVANMVFEGGVTSSFTMDAFTPHGGRRTRIMGTKGFIDGDSKQFTITDFRTGAMKKWNVPVKELADFAGAGHGGGDFGVVRDVIEAVAHLDPLRLTSTIDASIESHIMGFCAEKSRKSGKREKVRM